MGQADPSADRQAEEKVSNSLFILNQKVRNQIITNQNTKAEAEAETQDPGGVRTRRTGGSVLLLLPFYELGLCVFYRCVSGPGDGMDHVNPDYSRMSGCINYSY